MAITINGSTGITSSEIADGTITNADINSSAAIAGTKVDGSFGKVLQVVSVSKTDTYSDSSIGWSDITGMAVSITPTSSTSKILILSQITTGTQIGNIWALRLMRDSTLINMGNASGNAARGIRNAGYKEANSQEMSNISFLDSPATTSTVTYKLQCNTESGYTFYLNRADNSLNDTRECRTASNITLMEIGV